MKYSHLYVSRISREARSRTCGYWYVVQANVMTPHCAFRTRASMMQWLEDRGLKLTKSLDKAGDGCHIEGEWSSVYDSPESFAKREGKRIRTLSNGDYTDGVVVVDETGHHTVYVLGPNEKRVVHDYRESERLSHALWIENEAAATA